MTTAKVEATREMIADLRTAAEMLLAEPTEPAWGVAQGLSQIAESLATAAVRAGDHPLKYADSRYHHGGCPECGGEGNLVHVGRQQWLVCHEHRLAWLIGENLYSGWRDLKPEQHEANRQMIERYTVIEDATPANLCLACGQAAGQHERWCAHNGDHVGDQDGDQDAPMWMVAAMPSGMEDDPEIDLEVWGDL